MSVMASIAGADEQQVEAMSSSGKFQIYYVNQTKKTRAGLSSAGVTIAECCGNIAVSGAPRRPGRALDGAGGIRASVRRSRASLAGRFFIDGGDPLREVLRD